jgi:hypothetical protein
MRTSMAGRLWRSPSVCAFLEGAQLSDLQRTKNAPVATAHYRALVMCGGNHSAKTGMALGRLIAGTHLMRFR